MKIIYLILGILTMVIGTIGVILPVLPTTPFLLISAYCFAKSSKRIHEWFTHTKLYQNHLEQFVKERAMTLRTKIIILAFASSALLVAMLFMKPWYLRLLLVCVMIFKYYYFIIHIKTIKSATLI